MNEAGFGNRDSELLVELLVEFLVDVLVQLQLMAYKKGAGMAT